MIDKIVVDASVAIKWIVPEHDSEIANAFRKRHALIAPDLIYAECANILWKKVIREEMTREEADHALMFINALDLRTASLRELAAVAADLSFALRHAVYDCFYLALSVLEACSFVTADVKFHNKVQLHLAPSYSKRCILLGAGSGSQ